ncbi:anti-sigma-factor antagonist [Candidatus Magnetoovum chiemensis]|nr:anti-sigma-factor antagonist [Candidatus Magnetoovum chiemensis]
MDKDRAEANKTQAEAISQLIQTLSNIPVACLQIGSLLLIKTSTTNGEASIYARTLTPKEQQDLEDNPSMLNEPERILKLLQDCKRQ